MAQYQSFPGAPGDSLTLEKLKKLALPELDGRSFLDVGCNEGFFVGFARSLGASRAVGVDHSPGFIERARKRFPDCEFHACSWERLPEGPFDVILLASALHYADDQAGLLQRLVGMLSEDGVLVLELGIASSRESEWVKVKRGIDERLFPTMPLLRELLAEHAWKWMGPSVAQAGDPVGRHVLHVSPRKRTAYLLMQPPAYGKSSIARSLFPKAGTPVVSGDQVLGRIAAGKLKVSARLADAVSEGYSPFQLDRVIRRVFERGLATELAQVWIQQAGSGDFALDMYVPAEFQAQVRAELADSGYMPVVLQWDRPGARLLSHDVLQQRADAFYLSLNDIAVDAAHGQGMVGFVDEATLQGGELELRGWAADAAGAMPDALTVRVGDVDHVVRGFERQLRPDVQRHLGLPHALVGYRLKLTVDGVDDVAALGPRFAVSALQPGLGTTTFRLSAPLAACLQGEKP